MTVQDKRILVVGLSDSGKNTLKVIEAQLRENLRNPKNMLAFVDLLLETRQGRQVADPFVSTKGVIPLVAYLLHESMKHGIEIDQFVDQFVDSIRQRAEAIKREVSQTQQSGGRAKFTSAPLTAADVPNEGTIASLKFVLEEIRGAYSPENEEALGLLTASSLTRMWGGLKVDALYAVRFGHQLVLDFTDIMNVDDVALYCKSKYGTIERAQLGLEIDKQHNFTMWTLVSGNAVDERSGLKKKPEKKEHRIEGLEEGKWHDAGRGPNPNLIEIDGLLPEEVSDTLKQRICVVHFRFSRINDQLVVARFDSDNGIFSKLDVGEVESPTHFLY